jgi:hypothetical protein
LFRMVDSYSGRRVFSSIPQGHAESGGSLKGKGSLLVVRA